jgi:alanine racemase
MTEELSVWAEVDLGRIQRNVSRLRERLDPKTLLLAVVKADGYGHGATQVASAAIDGGAQWLGVARVQEAEPLRAEGISVPILVLAEPSNAALSRILDLDLTATIYTPSKAKALSDFATKAGRTIDVHVKVDTGMHRYGVLTERLPELIATMDGLPGVEVTGLWSHLAVSDEPANPYTKHQFERFIDIVESLDARSERLLKHLSNSAGLLAFPEAQFDMVRSGIAVYGIPPAQELEEVLVLEPALAFKSRVGLVKRLGAGEPISYGQRYTTTSETTVVTVPCGYADGLRRRLSDRADVLINGSRYRISGTITMDHFMVDVGDDDIGLDDEVVLIGRQGSEEITAQELAGMLDTIPYEVLCGINSYVPKIYHSSVS